MQTHRHTHLDTYIHICTHCHALTHTDTPMQTYINTHRHIHTQTQTYTQTQTHPCLVVSAELLPGCPLPGSRDPRVVALRRSVATRAQPVVVCAVVLHFGRVPVSTTRGAGANEVRAPGQRGESWVLSWRRARRPPAQGTDSAGRVCSTGVLLPKNIQCHT